MFFHHHPVTIEKIIIINHDDTHREEKNVDHLNEFVYIIFIHSFEYLKENNNNNNRIIIS